MSNLLFYHTLFCLYWNWRWIFSCFYSSVRCRILCLIKKRNYSNLTILAESFFIIRCFAKTVWFQCQGERSLQWCHASSAHQISWHFARQFNYTTSAS